MRISLLVAALLTAAAYGQPTVVGNWMGTLEAGPAKLRLGFHLTADSSGGLKATFDSLDQNALGIPAVATFANGKLHLEVPSARVQYDGTLSADGSQIAGTFTQGASLPLMLKRVDQVALPSRPQDPKPPYPYTAEEVGYENQGIHLAGTLTLPRGPGPFPAALMITGSGPQDRDEALLGHKPFWIIADYLTRRGIAVLRVDDRGVGKSTGSSALETLDDMAGDVLAGVGYLKQRKEIDGKHIGVIGHSEGGMVGPIAAVRSSDIAFVVMLAGPGTSFDQAVDGHFSQAEIMMRAAGAADPAIAWNNSIQKMIFKVIRDESDPRLAVQKMNAEFQQMKAALPEPQRKAMDTPEATASINQQFSAAMLPEMRSIFLDDPAVALRKVKVPVLALDGSRDVQVSAKQNLAAIDAALKEGGNRDVTVKELPGLNHLFQTCTKCTVAEYGDLSETFSPAALAVLGDWLAAHTRQSAQ